MFLQEHRTGNSRTHVLIQFKPAMDLLHDYLVSTHENTAINKKELPESSMWDHVKHDSVHAWPVCNTLLRVPILAIVTQVKQGINTNVLSDQWQSRQHQTSSSAAASRLRVRCYLNSRTVQQ